MSKRGVSYKQLKETGVLNTEQGWLPVAQLTDFKVSCLSSSMHVSMIVLFHEGSQAICPVITTTGLPVMLYRVREKVFCSEANATAYRFPMNDARIFDGPEGPAAECPLDGTTYDLQTGKVPSRLY